ncbi:MAG: lytic transglycosylase domain-containing protein [Mobilitalea sp.]
MADINGISNVDIKNTYKINTAKKSTESSADFASFLGETKSLDQIFEQASKKYNVSENLLKAIGKAESDFNSKAVSRCGAQGVMQLMPATAKSLGVTDSFDAEQNIMGGAKYISEMMKKYDGDTRLALAAYNAGSGNVAKYGGIPPFKETQNYVKKVMNYAGKNMDTEISSVDKSNNITSTSTNKNSSNITNNPTSTPAAPVRNNYSFIIANDTDNSATGLQDFDTEFSYDNYLKFIDMFLNNKEDEASEENKNNYSAQDISYNVPVMNLLKDQKFI